MKVGVVADIHSGALPKGMLKDFKTVDLIIHAGDFCSLEDLKALTKIKEVKAVYGNMDDAALRHLFPRRQILKVGSWYVGVFHGDGAPEDILNVVQTEFKTEKVDAIIFGHSHQPFNERIKGILYFNPGSPTDLVFAPYRSYGILEEKQGQLVGRIIEVKSDG